MATKAAASNAEADTSVKVTDYVCLLTIRRQGVVYKPGDTIALDDGTAGHYLRAGFVVIAAAAA